MKKHSIPDLCFYAFLTWLYFCFLIVQWQSWYWRKLRKNKKSNGKHAERERWKKRGRAWVDDVRDSSIRLASRPNPSGAFTASPFYTFSVRRSERKEKRKRRKRRAGVSSVPVRSSPVWPFIPSPHASPGGVWTLQAKPIAEIVLWHHSPTFLLF